MVVKVLPLLVKLINKVMKEVFKDVIGYEGIYQVSNLGRVKSLERLSHDGVRTISERILKLVKVGKKTRLYYAVNLFKNGSKVNSRVHQLVAKAFLDADYVSKGLVADHIDNNPLNNNLENLQIITPRENKTKDREPNKTGFVGVHKRVNASGIDRYYSVIRIDKKLTYLGIFDTPKEASNAYQNKLKEVA